MFWAFWDQDLLLRVLLMVTSRDGTIMSGAYGVGMATGICWSNVKDGEQGRYRYPTHI
jgi:hypothetical protein